MLIVLIGGRIVPSFTRNWLAKHGPGPMPAPFDRLDQLTMAGSLMALLAGPWSATSPVSGISGCPGRRAQRRPHRPLAGYRTGREPLVLVLHLGYVWIPVGLALLAASILLPAFPALAPIYAFGAGAFATMMLAVMTRATLGHTGRDAACGARHQRHLPRWSRWRPCCVSPQLWRLPCTRRSCIGRRPPDCRLRPLSRDLWADAARRPPGR